MAIWSLSQYLGADKERGKTVVAILSTISVELQAVGVLLLC